MLAAVTILPALLSLIGKPLDRVRLLPSSWLERRVSHERGFWPRLARTIMRRPVLFAVGASSILIALALPVLALQLGPGTNTGLPQRLEAVQGLDQLTEAVGAGATAPANVVVDTGRAGGAADPAITAAVARLSAGLERRSRGRRRPLRPARAAARRRERAATSTSRWSGSATTASRRVSRSSPASATT